MKLHDIKPNAGSTKKKTRRGRGDGSGKGNYSGRGMKGQNARTGGGVRLGFEGGQTTLLQRTPKLRGFKNPNRVEFLAVNLTQLDALYSDGDTVSPETLIEKGIIKTADTPVKILGTGSCKKKLTLENVKYSATVAKAFGLEFTKHVPKLPKKKRVAAAAK